MKNIFLIIIAIIFFVTAGWGVWNFYSAVNNTTYVPVTSKNYNHNNNDNSQPVNNAPVSANNINDNNNDYNQLVNNSTVNVNASVNTNVNANINVIPPPAPAPTTAPVTVAETKITLSSPTDNAHVVTPIEIKGQAKNGISKVNIRVTNLSGAPLINLTADVKFLKASSAWGDFKAKVAYEFSQTKEGYLEVYTEDAEGVRENIVKYHLYFD